jgi:hypothetical protein
MSQYLGYLQCNVSERERSSGCLREKLSPRKLAPEHVYYIVYTAVDINIEHAETLRAS